MQSREKEKSASVYFMLYIWGFDFMILFAHSRGFQGSHVVGERREHNEPSQAIMMVLYSKEVRTIL